MKPTTALVTLFSLAASAAAAEPSSCQTQNYATLTDFPQPVESDDDVFGPLIDYGSDQVISCVKNGGWAGEDCDVSNPSIICGFSTDGPSSAQPAWTSLISGAADWWTSNGDQIRSLRSECPDSWTKQALGGSPYAEAPMEVALAFAQCWASAQGETLSPTPALGPSATGSLAVPGFTYASDTAPAKTGAAEPTATDKDKEGAAAAVRAWGCGAVGLVAAACLLAV